jgi:dTMP kinase
VTLPGWLVTFEGGEGAGKSTQVHAVAELARIAGHEVVTCREPGGTLLGERLREALLDLEAAPEPLAELLVFGAARAQLVGQVIRPAIERGALVLCDRFIDSTVAYQYYGRGLPLDDVAAVNNAASAGLLPAMTVLLDLPPDAGRARGEDGGSDYLEREDLAFHERVREGYLAMANAEPDRWLLLDALRPREELTREVWARVQAVVGAAG